MLKTELRDSIRILTLDRPDKSNWLHPDLISSLAVVRGERDDAVRGGRAVVLRDAPVGHPGGASAWPGEGIGTASPSPSGMRREADADTAWSRTYPYRPGSTPSPPIPRAWSSWSGSRLTRKLSTGAPAGARVVPVTEDRLRRELEGVRAGPVDPTDVSDDPDPPGPDEMLGELERRGLVPAHLPPVTAVKPAQDGTLWLRREATGEDAAVWLVLSGEDGEPRGEVTLPADQEVITALGDVLVILEEDELEVPYILRYRIER